MKKKTLAWMAFGLGLPSLALLAACSGGTDGGSAGDETFDGTSYVSDDAGSIELDVLETNLNVSDVSGFFVRVRDASGRPVSGVRVICDTEAGLALIEPSDGQELTSSQGDMSGRVGCAKPGSYRMGCRLSLGGSKRTFEDMICNGPIPDGFDGFEGAGGGTLGGDSVDDFDPDDDPSASISIEEIAVFDGGSSPSDAFGGGISDLEIDTDGIPLCDPADPDSESEPYFNTVIGIDVENDSNESVNFRTMRFSGSNFTTNGGNFVSRDIALSNADEVPARTSSGPGQKRFIALMFQASSASGRGVKLAPGVGNQQVLPVGFTNLRVTLIGTSSSGRDVTVQHTFGTSFQNVDRCDN